ncbi:MAG: hypothetical protein JJU36_14930 [Phycisphaeraceae bacterium]|nr:hypothetical protein [Phycisphaeraceae bacterium]
MKKQRAHERGRTLAGGRALACRCLAEVIQSSSSGLPGMVDPSSLGLAASGDDRGKESESPRKPGAADGGRSMAYATVTLTLQRWLTSRHVINQFARPKFDSLDARVAAVLMTGATQLLWMPNQPAFAVVDDLVEVCRAWVHPKATGLVNAVLRRIAESVGRAEPELPWAPAPDRLPLEGGGTLFLNKPLLTIRGTELDHWEVSLSHPARLLRHWVKRHGEQGAIELALHGLNHPPIIIAMEPGGHDGGDGRLLTHREEGFAVWQGPPDELSGFLAGHAARRVQDPTAAEPVNRCAAMGIAPSRVLDLCAGRGTKAHQLAITYPQARIVAHDPDGERAESLRELAQRFENIEAVDSAGLEWLELASFDLLLLDVPCSNTGVLGRRPEARYRFTARQHRSLIELQRGIIEHGMAFLSPHGRMVYSTCSIEEPENEQQVAWACERWPLEIEHQATARQRGQGCRSRDGGFVAILRLTSTHG